MKSLTKEILEVIKLLHIMTAVAVTGLCIFEKYTKLYTWQFKSMDTFIHLMLNQYNSETLQKL